jgi:hypothetical protein
MSAAVTDPMANSLLADAASGGSVPADAVTAGIATADVAGKREGEKHSDELRVVGVAVGCVRILRALAANLIRTDTLEADTFLDDLRREQRALERKKEPTSDELVSAGMLDLLARLLSEDIAKDRAFWRNRRETLHDTEHGAMKSMSRIRR